MTRFVAQPFVDGYDLRDFLQRVASNRSLSEMWIIVAWAKRSGLSRVVDHLTAFRDRGGIVRAIVGVSEGGATRQGLELLMNLTDEAHVFHDAGRTFHPKVYLATGNSSMALLVGSHNLTAGGVGWNYEAGILIESETPTASEKRVQADIVAYYDRLLADTSACVALDPISLAAMLGDPRLMIGDEDQRKRVIKVRTLDEPEDSDSVEGKEGDGPATPVFDSSTIPKRKAPLGPRTKPHPRKRPMPVAVTGGGLGTNRADIDVVKRWAKLLKHSDAQQQKTPGSKRTGNLRLSQEDFSIDHKTYFRRVFLGGLDWAPARKLGMEEVWVSFDVVMDEEYLGAVVLRVSHWPKRIEGQGNVPTVLHWGDLGARMRDNNYLNQYVTLERSIDDRFALTVADSALGEFLY